MYYFDVLYISSLGIQLLETLMRVMTYQFKDLVFEVGPFGHFTICVRRDGLTIASWYQQSANPVILAKIMEVLIDFAEFCETERRASDNTLSVSAEQAEKLQFQVATQSVYFNRSEALELSKLIAKIFSLVIRRRQRRALRVMPVGGGSK